MSERDLEPGYSRLGFPSPPGRDCRRPGRPAFEVLDRPAADRFAAICAGIPLQRARGLSLWRQIAEGLEAAIRARQLAPGARIPSEQALAGLFDVSRPVVRNALQQLAARGLVIKLHRKGVYVGEAPPETSFITSNLAAYDDLVARGHRVTTRTFDLSLAKADDGERKALLLGPRDKVVRIGRVFLMDGRPITRASISFPAAKVPGMELERLEGRPILRFIHERYGRRLTRAERWFKAVLPSADVAEAMGLAPAMPVIWIESVAYEIDNSPLEYYRAHYNSELALIHISVIG